MTGHGTIDFSGAGELLVGVTAGVTCRGAEVEEFAEATLVVLMLIQAPLVIIGKDAEREAGGIAEGVLIAGEELRTTKLVKKFACEL